MNNVEVTSKGALDRLADAMFRSRAMMEIFDQIRRSPRGMSAFDIEVRSPSGEKMAYASVHRWIGILEEQGAVRETDRVPSRKGGFKIIYGSTEVGQKAFRLACEQIKKRFLTLAENESRDIEGLHAPDLLDAVLKLLRKKNEEERFRNT